jgi:hypothetical protein
MRFQHFFEIYSFVYIFAGEHFYWLESREQNFSMRLANLCERIQFFKIKLYAFETMSGYECILGHRRHKLFGILHSTNNFAVQVFFVCFFTI